MTYHSNNRAERLFSSIRTGPHNPYIFSAHKLVAPETRRSNRLNRNERDIVREQHQTLFESDEAMQELFAGNFEEYFRAIENPPLLMARMEQAPDEQEISEFFQDEEELADMEEAGEILFGDDPLYQACSAWSQHLHELGHQVYDHEARRDLDVFRVTINSILVGAKIAYALDIDEEELETEDPEVVAAEYEVSIRALNLASTFLSRVRESLMNLVSKKFEPLAEWRSAISEADRIAFEIQKRALEFRGKLQPPRE